MEKHSASLKYELPAENVSLASIFKILEGERNSGELYIADYSISQPTLEGIFVSIASEHEKFGL